jgi:hypothetical protein
VSTTWTLATDFACCGHSPQDQRERRIQVWQVLAAQPWPEAATWAQAFCMLTAEGVATQSDLYELLPDDARAENDGRYRAPPSERDSANGDEPAGCPK